jgi:hypothetical protein
MENYGTYTEYPEENSVEFEDLDGNIFRIDNVKYVDGEAMMSIDDTEELARWQIDMGNPLGYRLLEQVMKVRMEYNCKKIK